MERPPRRLRRVNLGQLFSPSPIRRLGTVLLPASPWIPTKDFLCFLHLGGLLSFSLSPIWFLPPRTIFFPIHPQVVQQEKVRSPSAFEKVVPRSLMSHDKQNHGDLGSRDSRHHPRGRVKKNGKNPFPMELWTSLIPRGTKVRVFSRPLRFPKGLIVGAPQVPGFHKEHPQVPGTLD